MFYRKHQRVTLTTGPDSMAKQSHKQECDINHILRQYQRTGIITHVQNARASYEDLPSDVDFQSSLHLLQQAQDTFDALPSKVRRHFDNDPEKFLRAFSDPAQADQLREFGFFKTEPAPPPNTGETS